MLLESHTSQNEYGQNGNYGLICFVYSIFVLFSVNECFIYTYLYKRRWHQNPLGMVANHPVVAGN